MSDLPVYTNGKGKISLCTPKEAFQWLTSSKWIVFSFDDTGFPEFLENTVFTPGTKKSAEFEVAMIPVEENGERRMTFWYRFFDTPENRVAFARAMELYYQRPLPPDWEKRLEEMRRRRRERLSYDDQILHVKI